ncbi:MAG TPA: PfkB family carbohydrate kinase [Candidatus Binataceae bacterium]|nr:PfkB family carbohydrate kinase [Candidatus Binataceae bacterium]
MAEAKLDVAGCGSMVVDLFYRTPKFVHAEQKIALDAHHDDGRMERAALGGLVLNHLGWARVLGLEVGVLGKIGADRHGEFLRRGMEQFGIRHHLTTDGSASSFAKVFVDARGGRAIYMARGATAELAPDEIRRRHAGFIRHARMVSTEISQLPLRTVLALLLFARANSIPTVLDVDLPPAEACPALGTRAELERALRLATILKPTRLAARALVGPGRDTLKLARAMRARYQSQAVIVTDGERGCAIAAAGVALKLPAFAVKVVDTTGAGDAFLGAMLAGLSWGLPWHAIGTLANAAGAVCVGRLGAFPAGFEVRDQVLALFRHAMPDQALPEIETPRQAGGPLDPSVEVNRFLELCLSELGTLRREIDLNQIRAAVDLIRAAESRGGRVHLTGVGKPEHVARYAASLLCSVGTQATFLHATETLHGSLGQVDPKDVVIAISNSGNTRELCEAAAAIKEHGAQLIAVTGNSASELSHLADLVINAPVEQEGGVLGLAPRISVLAEVCVLAALSVALEAARGLTLEQYGRWHRAGALGAAARRLVSGRHGRRKLKAVK